MQSGNVFRNNIFVGTVSRSNDGTYHFDYSQDYLQRSDAKAISLGLPLQDKSFSSQYLFAFFANMLAEGDVKEIQCKDLRIDAGDDFSRLLKTTSENTIGSITIKEVSR